MAENIRVLVMEGSDEGEEDARGAAPAARSFRSAPRRGAERALEKKRQHGNRRHGATPATRREENGQRRANSRDVIDKSRVLENSVLNFDEWTVVPSRRDGSGMVESVAPVVKRLNNPPTSLIDGERTVAVWEHVGELGTGGSGTIYLTSFRILFYPMDNGAAMPHIEVPLGHIHTIQFCEVEVPNNDAEDHEPQSLLQSITNSTSAAVASTAHPLVVLCCKTFRRVRFHFGPYSQQNLDIVGEVVTEQKKNDNAAQSEEIDASEEMVMSFEDLGQRDSEGQIDLCSLDSGSPVIEPTRVHVRPNDSILDDLLGMDEGDTDRLRRGNNKKMPTKNAKESMRHTINGGVEERKPEAGSEERGGVSANSTVYVSYPRDCSPPESHEGLQSSQAHAVATALSFRDAVRCRAFFREHGNESDAFAYTHNPPLVYALDTGESSGACGDDGDDDDDDDGTPLEAAVPLRGNELLKSEATRLRIDRRAWRLSWVNKEFETCTTYPQLWIIARANGVGVDAKSQDRFVLEASRYRSANRLPLLSWHDRYTAATITRCAQPLVGLFSRRSVEDERLLSAIRTANHNHRPLCVIDCRPRLSAYANTAKGAGTEFIRHYSHCTLEFFGIPNIHSMRDSLYYVYDLSDRAVEPGAFAQFQSKLESTGWLYYIQLLLDKAAVLASRVRVEKQSILIHCSDGWDRTAQLSSLTQLLLDPHYRTIRGFLELVEKDWILFGHKFGDRCGLGLEGFWEPHERSPIFLQWLDCVHQLVKQCPTAFQFTNAMLVHILDQVYAGVFGTFYFNNERERVVHKCGELPCLWRDVMLHAESRGFINRSYVSLESVLPVSVDRICFWTGYYWRYTSPPGLSERDIQRLSNGIELSAQPTRIIESLNTIYSKYTSAATAEKQRIEADMLLARERVCSGGDAGKEGSNGVVYDGKACGDASAGPQLLGVRLIDDYEPSRCGRVEAPVDAMFGGIDDMASFRSEEHDLSMPFDSFADPLSLSTSIARANGMLEEQLSPETWGQYVAGLGSYIYALTDSLLSYQMALTNGKEQGGVLRVRSENGQGGACSYRDGTGESGRGGEEDRGEEDRVEEESKDDPAQCGVSPSRVIPELSRVEELSRMFKSLYGDHEVPCEAPVRCARTQRSSRQRSGGSSPAFEPTVENPLPPLRPAEEGWGSTIMPLASTIGGALGSLTSTIYHGTSSLYDSYYRAPDQ